MRSVFSALIAYVVSHFRSYESLRLKNMALRHQLAVYHHTVTRPKHRPVDRLFWAWLSRLWPAWQHALEFVQPRTVIAWRKHRFGDYWRRLNQSGKPGRPAIPHEVCDLIQDLWRSNSLWGSPRIVGELRKLGITVAKSTVEKYRPRVRKSPSPMWKAFLHNHVKGPVACDFFTFPTASFKVLFVFIMLAHERQRIIHFNITEHPTAPWTAQQIVEAFPWESVPRYLLRDRDAIYSGAFQHRIRNMGIEEVKTAPRSPWQNPYCEWVIGSIRRDVIEHAIVLNDRHLKRLLTAYIAYYHRFRTHLSLAMDYPHPRTVQPPETGGVIALPEVGGLHHHYERQAA
jgi:transposase InsO family protein